MERLKETRAVRVEGRTSGTRLKTRVDVADDGSGVVRAKAWPRDEAEPEAWTIEVPHTHAPHAGRARPLRLRAAEPLPRLPRQPLGDPQ